MRGGRGPLLERGESHRVGETTQPVGLRHERIGRGAVATGARSGMAVEMGA